MLETARRGKVCDFVVGIHINAAPLAYRGVNLRMRVVLLSPATPGNARADTDIAAAGGEMMPQLCLGDVVRSVVLARGSWAAAV